MPVEIFLFFFGFESYRKEVDHGAFSFVLNSSELGFDRRSLVVNYIFRSR